MGYNTDFSGSFQIDKPLDVDTLNLLKGLNTTRRMARNVKGFGVEGEFFIDGTGFMGQDTDETVINGNKPPRTQPSLWCHWAPNKSGTKIMWDGGEKFYEYVEWIEYLIKAVLQPRGYTLNGEVTWQGEESGDIGKIIVENNTVKTKKGHVVFR